MIAMASGLDSMTRRKDAWRGKGSFPEAMANPKPTNQIAMSRSDCSPSAKTKPEMGKITANTSGKAMLALSAPQVLADDYWNIYRVMLR